MDKRFVSEGDRLISDILEITQFLKIKGLLLTVDILKAFDSVDQHVLTNLLKTFGFDESLERWIKILLNESYITNGGITTSYFKLERSTLQEDPISAYLLILVLEIVFPVIKSNQNSDKLRIFEHNFLYNAYVDDMIFFECLKPNKSRCEIARKVALN